MMKLGTLLLALAAQAIALPAAPSDAAELESRQSITSVTDQLLFSITLPAFTSRRNAKNPANLDWSSDGCSSSPDNPFGFPFVPACHRHDFGYRNYKAQNRFTSDGRLRIDTNFKNDLYYQCSGVSASGVCKALADVYYAAVRAFGGSGEKDSKRSTQEELVQEYEEKLAIYNQLVKEAQDKGELWSLE
ncbi:prokaryotic phospholipase A2-domain-containing protein [Echria macrotheca]|uniref:Prokaryotic phospholipase A2-domain-containing protein n=1 Tax=Echria macrotheca TaxID=438768 RepID=A0AAJ0BGR2_9PEZI|nr:prokaryotic phospholipase A2-domain-containing protein [Echria macrotheca]